MQDKRFDQHQPASDQQPTAYIMQAPAYVCKPGSYCPAVQVPASHLKM